MKFLNMFLLFYFGTMSVAMGQSAIHEIFRLESVLDAVKPNCIVLLDLDNTVFESSTMLGSDQWFDGVVEKLIRSGLDGESARVMAQTSADVISDHIVATSVESTTANTITQLQQQLCIVIGHTARRSHMIDATLRHLDEVGVNFKKSYPLIWRNGEFGPNMQFADGVIFANAQDKGLVLEKFLGYRRYRPASVIMVDDRMHNLEKVGRSAQTLRLPYTGFHYRAADAKVHAFVPAVAELQWQQLLTSRRALSDAEAIDRLSRVCLGFFDARTTATAAAQ